MFSLELIPPGLFSLNFCEIFHSFNNLVFFQTVSQWNLRKLALKINTRIIELIESKPEGTYTEDEVKRAYGNRQYYEEEIQRGNDYQGEQDLDIQLQRPPHNRYISVEKK